MNDIKTLWKRSCSLDIQIYTNCQILDDPTAHHSQQCSIIIHGIKGVRLQSALRFLAGSKLSIVGLPSGVHAIAIECNSAGGLWTVDCGLCTLYSILWTPYLYLPVELALEAAESGLQRTRYSPTQFLNLVAFAAFGGGVSQPKLGTSAIGPSL